MQLQMRFESLQNITGLFSCLFPEQLMTRSDSDLQDQVTKLIKKYSNDQGRIYSKPGPVQKKMWGPPGPLIQ